MIKVSILYPYRENGKFDVEYYCGTHMPLAAKLPAHEDCRPWFARLSP